MSWKLDDSESIIELIVAEIRQAAKQGSKHKLLKKWRAQLEGEPTRLQPYQIDMIVREVRRRLEEGK